MVDQWGEQLVGGWSEWIEAPMRTGDALAEVLGARPGEVLVADSTTVNLYKLVNALLDADPALRTLVTDADNFPTDRYVLEGIARARGLELRIFESADPLLGPQPDDLWGPSLAVISHVGYRSGALADMAALDRRTTVIWDLSHSAGAVPIDLHAHGIRYAVGCTYKYLNAGPGAVGYLYIAKDEQEALRTPIQGWFGQADQFAMERPYEPAPGISRFLAGTPPILVLAAVEEGVRITAEAGIEALREKSIALTELLIALHDEWLTPLGFKPRLTARPRAARLARVPEPSRGVADLPRADRARGRHPRLPRPGQRAARRRPALHPLRRRLRRARPPARAGRARRAARGRSGAGAGHLAPSPLPCAAASPPRTCPRCASRSSSGGRTGRAASRRGRRGTGRRAD